MLNSELLFLYFLAVRCLPELKFTCPSADSPFSQKQTQEMGKLFGITMLITFAFFFLRPKKIHLLKNITKDIGIH